jgi:hypothetical protein
MRGWTIRALRGVIFTFVANLVFAWIVMNEKTASELADNSGLGSSIAWQKPLQCISFTG